MGVTVPVYVSADTGATFTNVYVSLLNNSLPLQTFQNIGGRGYTRAQTSNVPLVSMQGRWNVQQASSHTSLSISRTDPVMDASGVAVVALPSYEVSATMAVFVSTDARTQLLSPVDSFYVNTSVDMNSNLATAIYTAVKVMYPGSVDA